MNREPRTSSDPDWNEEPAPEAGLETAGALPDTTEPEPAPAPAPAPPAEPTGRRERHAEAGTMIPAREHRRTKAERGLMRLVATAGIIGIAVLLGAILVSQDVAGWIVGLVIGLVSVALAAVLWSSREL
jgi:hypothetical protein